VSEKKKSYLTGAAILAAGGIFAKFLGMFFKIPLASTIGDYGLGLYSFAYPLYNTFLSISIVGLPVAVSKMVSERVSLGNYKGAYKVFYVAFVTLAVLGGVSSLAMFTGARFFIRTFNWDPEAYYSIIALSLAPLFVALISAVRGFFQGMQNMSYSSVSQIVEQIGRVGIGLALAIIFTKSYGVPYGAAGATFGATAGAIIAFVFLYFLFIIFRKKQSPLIERQSIPNRENTMTIFKLLVLMAIPVAFGGLINTIMDLINSATIATCLQNAGITSKEATTLFGQLEQKAQTLINVPLILGSALSASLVPSISQSYARREKTKIIEKTSLAVRIAFFISMPCAVGLSVLSEPIIKLLFGNSDGHLMLRYLAYVVIFQTLMISLQGILQGSGRFYKPLKNLAFGALIKYLFNIALISNPDVGIYGAIFSSIFAAFVIFLLNYIDVKKYVGIKPISPYIYKTLFASVAMGVFAHFSYGFFKELIGYKIGVLLCIALSAALYMGLIFVTKALTQEDLREVRG